MYTIYLKENDQAAVTVYVDGHNPSAIPAFILAGVGDKKKRYKDWLDKCFNDNSKLLNFFAYIHDAGKNQGSIALVCNCNQHVYHTAAIKEFLIEHEETLDAILPYLVPNVNRPSKTEILVNQEGNPTMDEVLREKMPDFQMSTQKANLSPEDMRQITELIKQDQMTNSVSVNAETQEISIGQDTITPQ